MPANKIVVHNKDGKVLKGTTVDFSPSKPVFHLSEGILGGEIREISVDNLKGVFFVKSFDGNKNYNEIKGFFDSKRAGKRIKVIFKDGELINGYTHVVNFEHLGFFFVPSDPNSNNERIFAVFSSIHKIKADRKFLLKRKASEMIRIYGINYSERM